MAGDAAPLERTIDKNIADRLKARGGWSLKTTGVKVAGTPDRLVCYRGRFIAWEVKRPGGKGATPRQRLALKMIARAGGAAGVIRTVDEADRFLDAVEHGDTFHLADDGSWTSTPPLETP